MSKEFISRADLEFDFLQCNGTSPKWTTQRVAQLIHRQDNADVAQVVHGRWVVPVPGDGDAYCSNCKSPTRRVDWAVWYTPPYCPLCGAKMDLEVKTE